MDSPMKIFAGVWFMVVVGVLTIIALCKLGGALFDVSGPHYTTPAEVYAHACYESQQGDENGVPNTAGAPNTWTCELPKGETK